MAEEGDNAQLQDRIKDLEAQLQDVQKRTRNLVSPQTGALDAPEETLEPRDEARDSLDFRETSSFPVPKDPEFPAVRERSNRATGRYDQDVGDLAQSKDLASEPLEAESEEEEERDEEDRGPAAPQQPYYQQGMMPPQMQSFYPMYPPPYYPMPQMNFMPPMQPMPMPQYQSFDGGPYWRQPESRPPQQRPPPPEEDYKTEVAQMKEYYESVLRAKEEEIDRLHQAPAQESETQEESTLLRKLQVTEEELVASRKEMELARDYIEKFKTQFDEKERVLRIKLHDLDRENKSLKEKTEKLEAGNALERQKVEVSLDRANQAEELISVLQEKLTLTTKDLDELKRTKLQFTQKYQSDVDALKKEVKSVNNALEQAYLQLDQAKHDLVESEKRAKINGQEQANVEINRLTQQVHQLRRQLEASGDNYASSQLKCSSLQAQLSQGSVQRTGLKSPEQKPEPQYVRTVPKTAKPQVPEDRVSEEKYEWAENPRPRTQASTRTAETTEIKDPVQALENQLVLFQMEKQQLESEYLKLPDRGRTIAIRKRKEELEVRLKTIDSSVGSIKSQLRSLKVLHK